MGGGKIHECGGRSIRLFFVNMFNSPPHMTDVNLYIL
jgi:hypothetical protein